MSEIYSPYEGLKPPAGGDKILVLGQEIAARRVANPDKEIANGVVGIFLKPDGKEFVFPEVEDAWNRTSFGATNYLPASGEKKFIEGTENLVFGDDADQVRENGIATLGTVGGTGALSMWAQFHRKTSKGTPSPILVSDPTWPNHPQIFKDQGIPILTYKHLTQDNKYDVEAHADAIKKGPEGTEFYFIPEELIIQQEQILKHRKKYSYLPKQWKASKHL
jgi:aspartate aminotransferase